MGRGYNTYGTGNQYPDMGYWILRGDTKLWILVSQLDTEKKYKFPDTPQNIKFSFLYFFQANTTKKKAVYFKVLNFILIVYFNHFSLYK